MSINRDQGVRAVTVPTVTAPNSVTVITAPCRLAGWSLQAGDAAGLEVSNSVTSPGALQTISGLGVIPGGEYTVSWQVTLSGTLSATDVNNFALQVNNVTQVTSDNPGAAGTYQQEPVSINVPAGGATVRVVSVVAGTAGAVYEDQFTLTPLSPAQGQILDSGQLLGCSAPAPGATDTQWLADLGIYVSTSLTVKALQGTISGVLYLADFDAYAEYEAWRQTKSIRTP